MKRSDVKLAAVLLAVALIAGGIFHMTRSPVANRAEITVNGEIVEILDLNKNQGYTVYGAGGTNLLMVGDGEIWCEDATCPDKLCVEQGRRSGDGSVIVCLPHKMIVRIYGE